jgi:protein CpxP
MKKIIFAAAAGILLIAGSIFVIAQKAGDKDGRHFGGRGHHGVAMFLRGLDLTDEQKAKVKEIMETGRANVDPLMAQLRDGHKRIAVLGTDGKFDQAKVEAVAAEQAAVMAKLIVEKEKAKAQVFAILTDEQKAKAAEMRTKAEERFKNGNGFRGKRAGTEF